MQFCPECEESVAADVSHCPNCGVALPTSAADESTEAEPIDIEWECAACGRTHVKNSPPCSRCGHTVLDRQPIYPSDMEFSTVDGGGSRRDYLKYGGGVGLAILAGGYLYVDGTSTPEMPDADGQADSANGIEFAAAESRLRKEINQERDRNGVPSLQYDESLDKGATYNTRYMVVNGFGNTADMGEVLEEFGATEYDEAVLAVDQLAGGASSRPLDSMKSASELGNRFASRWLSSAGYRNSLLSDRYANVGLDLHVDADGSVFLTGVWTN